MLLYSMKTKLIIGIVVLASLLLFAVWFSRCGKPAPEPPFVSPPPTASPSPTPSPETIEPSTPTVKSQPQAQRAQKAPKKKLRKGKVPIAHIPVPCPSAPVADWADINYNRAHEVRVRIGTVTDVGPCLFTVRFTEGDSMSFPLSGLSNLITLGENIQVRYWIVNHALGYAGVPDRPSPRVRTAARQTAPTTRVSTAHWPGEKLGTFKIPDGMMIVVTTNPEPRKIDGVHCPDQIFAPCWRDVNGERWQFNRCFKQVSVNRFEAEPSCAWQRRR